MGEETEKTAPAATEEVVVVNPDVPVSTSTTTTTDKEAVGEVEAEKPKKEETGGGGEEEKITESAASSFKEESNVVGELPDPEKKALDDLKLLIKEALNNHDFTILKPKEEEEKEKPEAAASSKKEEEETKPDAETPATELPPPPPPPPVETKEEVEEEQKASTAAADEDDDVSAKTVEAIKETIVEVVSASAPAPAPASAPKEEEEEAAVVPTTETEAEAVPEEVSIWGIKLLADEEKSDVILLKFLRARDFKVKEAFSMIKNTVRWRKEFGIDSLVLEETEEETENGLDKVVFMHGFDKQGHPVCYNAYGEFQNKELYQNTFSDEDKRLKFLRWRIQFLENSIRKLDFSPDGISTIVQINDLKNSPGPFKRDLRLATNQALQLLQDNYPEFVAQQVFINVPWWYLAFYKMISPFFTLRTKSKFVFAGPSKSAETLFKYIAPEQVPVQYGGLSREGEQEFTVADPVTEETIKQTTKHTVEFPVTEKCLLVWEARVVGWEVSYGAEFVPSAEHGYTVIVQKSRKISPSDEPIISNNFKVDEPGKVVLTFDNQTTKKKKLLYRSKTQTL